MNDLDKDLAALRALAQEAAPMSSAPHATDGELARVRADDESSELDRAHRHIASCAACRARLLDAGLPARLAAAVALASDGTQPPLASDGARIPAAPGRPPREAVVALAPRRRVLLTALAAAAAVALALGAGALRRRDGGPIAITQHAYAGMMGQGEAQDAAIAPADADVELSFAAEAGDEAALAVVDQKGHTLAPVRWFARGQAGRLVVVVAPRTFATHEGAAFGLVIVGDAARVREAAEGASARSLEAAEEAIRARGGDVRVRRIVIEGGNGSRVR